MQLQVPVSVGEALDKITILQIKLAHISDAAKRANIQNELDALLPLVAGDAFTTDQMQALMAELKSVNEALWDIEDDIREKEAAKSFDAEFIRLARTVYITNDKRANQSGNRVSSGRREIIRILLIQFGGSNYRGPSSILVH